MRVVLMLMICLWAGLALADEDDCEDRERDPCNTGEPGICAEGHYHCRDGELSCHREHDPVREDCDNGRDDDCDGDTDAADDACGPPACPDRDHDGWAVCAGGCVPAGGVRCGDCNDDRQSVNPDRAEACNGRDDDCDGDRDEGNPGGGAVCRTGEPGICDAGTVVCASGGLHCASNLAPRDEDCDNGLDDDCNGQADAEEATCRPNCGSTADGDADHVADCADNCPATTNHGQQDFDGDGMGDACETGARLCDIDRSGRVDGVDLTLLGRGFGRSCDDEGFDRRADLTRDCAVDGDDLAVLAPLFGGS